MNHKSLNLYKCTNHTIDLACLGCMKSWIARHDKMVKFIKSLKCCICQGNDCSSCLGKDLLKEIGELKEKENV